MLTIVIPDREGFDEAKQEFVQMKGTTLHLEHSLVSISKWEAKYKKPFLSKEPKTTEEIFEYVKFMTLTQNVNPDVYLRLTKADWDKISEYIEDPMTASSVHEPPSTKKSSEQVTSELIYWWMTALQIPWEAQKWHLNRLMMLIRIGNVKSQPPKKMSKKDILANNAKLNAERRKKLGTKG